ncbi:transposase, partial [Escherichia coli]|uniref:transposase n=1 Tax=Escherichia coli TaxID=562 RepID=UPI0010CC6CA7
DLQNRGVEDILIACVDGLTGFPEAINSIYPQTEVQLFVINQIRNPSKKGALKHHKEFLAYLKQGYPTRAEKAAETAHEKEEMKKGGERKGGGGGGGGGGG